MTLSFQLKRQFDLLRRNRFSTSSLDFSSTIIKITQLQPLRSKKLFESTISMQTPDTSSVLRMLGSEITKKPSFNSLNLPKPTLITRKLNSFSQTSRRADLHLLMRSRQLTISLKRGKLFL